MSKQENGNSLLTRRALAVLLAPALALGSAGIALAGGGDKQSQAMADQGSQKATSYDQQSSTMGQGHGKMGYSDRGTMADRSQMGNAQAGDRFARVSRLIGTEVRNGQGESLGDIDDLIIDARDGTVRYAVLSFGGFLGMGDKLFAYPMSAFTPSARGHSFILNVDKSRLKNAPGFSANDWPNWDQTVYTAEVDRYFGSQPRAKGQGPLYRASELIDAEVSDRNGRDIGHVNDIVVNTRNGNVDYAVIEVDRLTDFPDKLVQVPITSLKQNGKDRDELMLNASASSIDARQGFSRRDWPDLNDRVYRTTAYGYVRNGPWQSWYEVTPGGSVAVARTATQFDMLDRNNDGLLTREEFTRTSQQ